MPQPVCDEWSFQERLTAERDSLGLYLSGHPFDPYAWDARFIAKGNIASLVDLPVPAGNGEGYKSGRDMTVAGMIGQIRKRGTRVTVELEDGSGRLEVSFFQDAWARHQHMLQPGSFCVIGGRLRFDEFADAWRMVARDVEEIDSVIEKRARQLVIRWNAGDTGPDMGRLKSLLETYRPGRCRVSVHLVKKDAEARINLGSDWGVRPSRALRDTLSDVVGPEAFRFVYSDGAAT